MVLETEIMPETQRLRIYQTRQHFLDVFEQLVKEKGFQQVTVRDLTERAQVNRSTFYRHFIDKYDLMETFFRANISRQLSLPGSFDPSSKPAQMNHLVQSLYNLLEPLYSRANPCKTSDRQYEAVFLSALQKELEGYLLQWARQNGEKINDTQALAISGAILGCAVRWASERVSPTKTMADELVTFLLTGIE